MYIGARYFGTLVLPLRKLLPYPMEEQDPIERELSNIWQMVPPTEKNQLMAQVQSQGAEACVILLIITSATAFSLKAPWLMLLVAVFLPFMYQTTTTRLWRELKQKISAQYFLASQAAKHFALRQRCDDISLAMIFRATALGAEDESVPSPEVSDSETDSTPDITGGQDVWVSLFQNSLFMVRESDSGAVLECGLDSLEDIAITLNDTDETNTPNHLIITKQSGDGEERAWILHSRFTETLKACEHRFNSLVSRQQDPPQIAEITESN